MDSGAGKQKVTVVRISGSFFNTEDARMDARLDLSVVHSIVREREGWFDIEGRSGHSSISGAVSRLYVGSSRRWTAALCRSLMPQTA